jgi:hypothetical protein
VLLASLLPGPVTPAHLLFGLDGLSVGLLALNWLPTLAGLQGRQTSVALAFAPLRQP